MVPSGAGCFQLRTYIYQMKISNQTSTVVLGPSSRKLLCAVCCISFVPVFVHAIDYTESGIQTSPIIRDAAVGTDNTLTLNNVQMGSAGSLVSASGILPVLVSLGGDNNSTGVDTELFGSLSVFANGGSFWGQGSGQVVGLYAESLSDNSLVNISSNADISISSGGLIASGTTQYVIGILAQDGGVNGGSLINLTGGTIGVSVGSVSDSALFFAAAVRSESLNPDTGASAINVQNNVTVNTSGEKVMGLVATAAGTGISANATVDASNAISLSISTNGINAYGVFANSVAGASIVTLDNATINTNGERADGVFTNAGSGASTVSLSNSTLTVTGTNAYGVFASSLTGVATVNLTATDISTNGGHGVSAASGMVDSGESVLVTLDENSSIHVTSSNTWGISAASSGYGSSVRVENAGIITIGEEGTNVTDSIGLFAGSQFGDITVLQSGTVQTYGDGDYGVWAVGNGNITITNDNLIQTGSDTAKSNFAQGILVSGSTKITTVINNSSIITTGQFSNGMNISAGGDIEVTNNGSIETNDALSHGIFTSNSSGNISIVNSGGIHVTSLLDETYGINSTAAGSLSITNSGSIESTGANTAGIYGESTSTLGTDSIVINTEDGSLITSGGIGINARTLNGTRIEIRNDGNITSQGDGIVASGRDVFISGEGSVTSLGARGIYASSDGGSITVNLSGGSITSTKANTSTIDMQGINGASITINSAADLTLNVLSSETGPLAAGAINAVTDSGAIDIGMGVSGPITGNLATYDDKGHGIYAVSSTGSINIFSAASITTNADDSYGIFATVNSQTGTQDINIMSSGPISTRLGWGISAVSNTVSKTDIGGNVIINATGNLDVNGTGINAMAQGANARAEVNYNAGKITVSSVSALGIVVWDFDTGSTGTGVIHVGSSAEIDASVGLAGVQGVMGTANTITIDFGAIVKGGIAGVSFYNIGIAQDNVLDNYSNVQANVAGLLMDGVNAAGSQITVNNYAGASISGNTGIVINDAIASGTIINHSGASISGFAGTAIELNAQNITIKLFAQSVLNGGIVNNAENNHLVLDGNIGETDTFDAINVTGTQSLKTLLKDGDGTWNLSGNLTVASTEDKAVYVQSGTLHLQNAVISTGSGGNMSVAAGTMLSGDGTINGDFILDGNIAPGNSPGMISINGNVFLNSTSIFYVEIASLLSYDSLDITGNLDILSGAQLSVAGIEDYLSNMTDSDSFHLIDLNGGLNGTFADDTYVLGDRTFLLDYRTDGVWLIQVPEPGAYAVLFGSLALGIVTLRRRRKQGIKKPDLKSGCKK